MHFSLSRCLLGGGQGLHTECGATCCFACAVSVQFWVLHHSLWPVALSWCWNTLRGFAVAGSVTGGVERSLGRGQIGRSRHPTPVGGDSGMHCFGWRVRVGISASPCALQFFYFAGVYISISHQAKRSEAKRSGAKRSEAKRRDATRREATRRDAKRHAAFLFCWRVRVGHQLPLRLAGISGIFRSLMSENQPTNQMYYNISDVVLLLFLPVIEANRLKYDFSRLVFLMGA